MARRSFAFGQMPYSASRREQPLPRRAPAAELPLLKTPIYQENDPNPVVYQ